MAVKDLINTKKCLFICNGGCCMKKDAEEVTQAIRRYIKNFNLDDEYHTVRTKCIGRCDDAPVAMLSPENIWLKNIDPMQCGLLLNEIQEGKIKESKTFLYQMGELTINSDSIPTKNRKK
jgi:(2Fe-2S) ferredoxin